MRHHCVSSVVLPNPGGDTMTDRQRLRLASSRASSASRDATVMRCSGGASLPASSQPGPESALPKSGSNDSSRRSERSSALYLGFHGV